MIYSYFTPVAQKQSGLLIRAGRRSVTFWEYMEEIWKDITEYEGIYQVSSLGRVRSLDRVIYVKDTKRKVKGKIIKSFPSSGYLIVALYNNGIKKEYLVHRLVCSAFSPNVNNLPEVNHINHDKFDNVYTNLEWCTRNYNIKDATIFHLGEYKNSNSLYENEINRCPICWDKIYYTSKKCKKCSDSSIKKQVIKKEDIIRVIKLYKGNFTKSSKHFEISDNGLRKWCKRYNLPTKSNEWKCLSSQ